MRPTIKYFAVVLLGAALAVCMPAQTLKAQEVAPSVLPALGGTMHNGNYVLTYTVGQLPTQQIRVNNLVLTPGFQQPIKPEPPLVPAAQMVCSDTAYTFTFNAQAGKGANKVEWANNSGFTGSHIINLQGNFTLTVDTGAVDTIWLRSLDSIEGTKSTAVTTTATVHVFPNALISPTDTTIAAGDAVLLTASGGGTYFWPQFGTSGYQQSVVLDTLVKEYAVRVYNSWGCMENKTSILRASSSSRGIFTSLTINDTAVAPNRVAYACHDTGKITVGVFYSPDSNYTISLDLPSGWVPFLSSASPPYVVSSWDSARGVFTWDIPDSLSLDTFFSLSVSIYFDCATRFTQDSLADSLSGKILTNTSSSLPISVPTNFLNVSWPNLNVGTGTIQYVNPGTVVIDTFSICANSGRIYGLTIQPFGGDTGSVQITPSGHPTTHITLTYNSTAGGYVLDSADLVAMFGEPYMNTNQCFTLKLLDSVTAPGTCGEVLRGLYVKVACNTWYGHPPLDTSCISSEYTNIVQVADDGNAHPLHVQTLLFAGGSVSGNVYSGGTNVTTTGLTMCDSVFTVEYIDSNPGVSGNSKPRTYYQKTLDTLQVWFDPFWINAINLKVLYTPGNLMLPFTDAGGLITITFPADSPEVLLYDSAKGIVQLTGLQVNYSSLATACTLPDTALMMGIAQQDYITLCGTDTFVFGRSSSFNVLSYENIDSTQIAGMSGNSGDISLGHDATLTFCWYGNYSTESPWQYTYDTLSFFDCDSTSYLAKITIPDELVLTSDTVAESVDGIFVGYIPLTQITAGTLSHNGTFLGNLVSFNGSVCLSINLSVTTCPPGFTGGIVNIPCELLQRCLDTSSSCRSYRDYCFANTSSELSVHCPGVCNSTGIGTDSMVITNLNTVTDSTPTGLTSAYACDTIEFNVTGTGYFSGPAPGSTNEIFLTLTYPNADYGDTIFDFSSASAWYSYGGSAEVPISHGSITAPVLSDHDSTWVLTVPITDTAACDSIRRYGDAFVIDLKMKVRCNLSYNANGVYGLDYVTALMEFKTTSDTAYSCDLSATGLTILDHQYGTSALFLPLDTTSNICRQTLEVEDSVTGGEVHIPEMGNLIRPLINWPTDGRFRVIYDKRYLSVEQLIYSNSHGFTFHGTVETDTICSPYISYSDPANLSYGNLQDTISHGSTYDTLKLFGFSDTCGIHFWPDFGKDGTVFYDRLQVVFNMAGCVSLVNNAIVVLPHQQQDGKDSAECASGCSQWIYDTIRSITPARPSGALLAAAVSMPLDTFNARGFTDTLDLSRINYQLGISNIWVEAAYTESTAQGITMTYPDSTTNLIGQWLHATADTLPFNFSVSVMGNNCNNQDLKWKIAYVCPAPGASLDTLPFIDTSCLAITTDPTISVNVYKPNITVTVNSAGVSGYPNAYTFDNCKGICDGDAKIWTLDITNNATSGAGYAFDPRLILAQTQGGATLDIGTIVFKHRRHGLIGNSIVDTINAPVALHVFDFDNAYFDALKLDSAITATDTTPVHYLRGIGDTIVATITVYGNAASCGWDGVLQGTVSAQSICGEIYPVTTTSSQRASISYFFDLDTCNPVVCNGFAQDTTGISQVCNPCEASPIIVTPTVMEAACGDSNGTVSIRVSGGEPTFYLLTDSIGAPVYTYTWFPSGTGTHAVNLSGGEVVSVTVSNGTCADTLTLLINNSGMTITDSVVNVDCNGDSSGAIWLHVSPDSGTYVYHWNTGATDSAIAGLSAGLYIVTITNVHGSTVCTDSTIDSIVVSQFSTLNLTVDASNPACNDSNGTLLAHVSGGVSPYSYHWYGGSTSDILTNLGSGIYILTVTDANGCVKTDSITLTQISNVPSKVILTGSPCDTTIPYMILWDSLPPGVHATYAWSNSYIGDTSILPPGTFGTYSVTATIAGCISTATLNLPPFAGPNIIVHYGCEPTLVMNFFGTDTLSSAAQGTPPYTLVFTDAHGLITSIHPYLVNDSLTLVASIPFNLFPDSIQLYIQDAFGCYAIEEILLYSDSLLSCCFTATAENDTILSDTFNVAPGSFIYINPGATLIIDSTFTFQNCEVVMGTNSQVIVETGDTLNILGSTFKGCDTMWTGIFVYDGAAINVDSFNNTRSVIEDAIDGITMVEGNPGVKMFIRHTDFYKDEYGVVLYNYVPANYNYDISDCYFGMGTYSRFLPGPHGDSITRRPIAGIYVYWTTPIDLTYGFDTLSIPNPRFNGLRNTFQYMNTGIYCISTVANVYTNTFDSIRNYEAANPTGLYGAAIAGTLHPGHLSGFGSLSVQTDSSAPDSLSTVRFRDCDYGVKTQNFALNVLNNRMENVTYGVYSQNTVSRVTVNSNYIHQTSYGISLVNNSGSTQNANSNTIYVNPPINEWVPITGHTVTWLGGTINVSILELVSLNTYGIYQTDVGVSAGNIEYNAIHGGRNCIWLNNTKGTLVKDNNLYQTDSTMVGGEQAGLYTAGCSGLYVSGNACYGDSNYYAGVPNPIFSAFVTSNRRKTGFSFYSSPTGFVCGNQAGGYTSSTGLGYGMLVAADCYSIVLHANSMNQSTYGLVLQSSGIASVLNSQGGLYESQQNNFNGDGSGNFLSNYSTGTFLNLTVDSFVAPLFYYNLAAPLTDPVTDTATLNGSAYLPARVKSQQTISDNGFNTFCNIYRPLPYPFPIHRVGLLDTIIAQNNTRNYMEPDFDTTGTWLVSKILYEELYNTGITDTNSVLNTFYANKDTSDIGAILSSELSNVFITDSTVLADTSDGKGGTGYSDALAGAVYANSIIPDSNVQAVNYKAMNSIYLNTLAAGIDTFTSGQLDTIAGLAVKCPYTAGDAVYMARALYAQYNNTVFFDDLAICTPAVADSDRMLMLSNVPQDTATDTVKPTEYIIVFPNPAKNILKVFYSAPNNKTMTFELTDVTGQTIISKPVTAMGTIELDVTRIASSLYLWRGRNGNQIIQNGKVSIQK